MAKNTKKSTYSTFGFRLLLVTTVVTLSLFGVKNLLAGYESNNVLGTTSYLAERGSNSLESSEGKEEQQQEEVKETPEPTEVEDENQDETTSQFSLNNLKELQVRTEKNKTKIKLDSRGGSFELENEDGKLKIKVKERNGNEFELESETLDDINEALRSEGISVATSSGNNIRIKRGLFEAETHFPLSISPTTNTLTITTPAGVKDVAVLPDQAVANLLRERHIDRIASGSALENPTGIRLGLLNDNPVFQVSGTDDQKFLGILPISINKISFISAETGKLIKIDESFLNKLLDFLSVE